MTAAAASSVHLEPTLGVTPLLLGVTPFLLGVTPFLLGGTSQVKSPPRLWLPG